MRGGGVEKRNLEVFFIHKKSTLMRDNLGETLLNCLRIGERRESWWNEEGI